MLQNPLNIGRNECFRHPRNLLPLVRVLGRWNNGCCCPFFLCCLLADEAPQLSAVIRFRKIQACLSCAGSRFGTRINTERVLLHSYPGNRFVCARQLKSVRKQFNEYGTMRRTLLCMIITLASSRVVLILLEYNPVLQRRVGVLCECELPYRIMLFFSLEPDVEPARSSFCRCTWHAHWFPFQHPKGAWFEDLPSVRRRFAVHLSYPSSIAFSFEKICELCRVAQTVHCGRHLARGLVYFLCAWSQRLSS